MNKLWILILLFVFLPIDSFGQTNSNEAPQWFLEERREPTYRLLNDNDILMSGDEIQWSPNVWTIIPNDDLLVGMSYKFFHRDIGDRHIYIKVRRIVSGLR